MEMVYRINAGRNFGYGYKIKNKYNLLNAIMASRLPAVGVYLIW